MVDDSEMSDVAAFLAADTTDVLAADTTDVLSAAKAADGGFCPANPCASALSIFLCFRGNWHPGKTDMLGRRILSDSGWIFAEF